MPQYLERLAVLLDVMHASVIAWLM